VYKPEILVYNHVSMYVNLTNKKNAELFG